jgi:mycofactocin precursor
MRQVFEVPEVAPVLEPDVTNANSPENEEPPDSVDELLIEEISIDGMCGVY